MELAGLGFVGESAKTKKQAEKNAAIAAWSALKTSTILPPPPPPTTTSYFPSFLKLTLSFVFCLLSVFFFCGQGQRETSRIPCPEEEAKNRKMAIKSLLKMQSHAAAAE